MKISKYLKNRPLPSFDNDNYNEGFYQGYKLAIQLAKKIEKLKKTKNEYCPF